MLAVNEHPVEAAGVDDGLGQWGRGVAVPSIPDRRGASSEWGDLREPEAESGLASSQLSSERSLHGADCSFLNVFPVMME